MDNSNHFEEYPVEINPFEIIEQLVEHNDWMFDRRSDTEMAVQVPGTWCNYSLYFAWNNELEALHFTCAFDMRVAEEQKEHIYKLIALINEHLWLGNFGLWDEEGLPMYRHALLARGTRGLSIEQIEDLVETALIECEKFYPALQFVIWGGKNTEDAMQASMIETAGEA